MCVCSIFSLLSYITYNVKYQKLQMLQPQILNDNSSSNVQQKNLNVTDKKEYKQKSLTHFFTHLLTYNALSLIIFLVILKLKSESVHLTTAKAVIAFNSLLGLILVHTVSLYRTKDVCEYWECIFGNIENASSLKKLIIIMLHSAVCILPLLICIQLGWHTFYTQNPLLVISIPILCLLLYSSVMPLNTIYNTNESSGNKDDKNYIINIVPPTIITYIFLMICIYTFIQYKSSILS